jgi:hypothetical protein
MHFGDQCCNSVGFPTTRRSEPQKQPFHHTAIRVLCVFDELRGLELVMKRLGASPEFESYEPQIFLIKTLPELRADFLHSWRAGRTLERRTVNRSSR